MQGARPLFFLDYLSWAAVARRHRADRQGRGPGVPGKWLRIARRRKQREMPGFYADGEYDVAGFIVGVVSRSKVIDGRRYQGR